METYAYLCLLSVLTVGEPFRQSGRVGGTVTVNCSGWDSWPDVKTNAKYLCNSPCLYDEDIIFKAAYQETTGDDRIRLNNSGYSLYVTFSNLQMSDSKSYVCGVDRTGPDVYIDFTLIVIEDTSPSPPVNSTSPPVKSTSPKTTLKTVTVGSTLSFQMTNDNFDSTTPVASATRSAGSVPYLVVGVIALVIVLMVTIVMVNKKMRKEPSVVSSATDPRGDTEEDDECDDIGTEDKTYTTCLYASYPCQQYTEESGNSREVYYWPVGLRSLQEGRVQKPMSKLNYYSVTLYSILQSPETARVKMHKK